MTPRCRLCDSPHVQATLVRFPCNHRVRACCATKLVARARTLRCPWCDDVDSVTALDRVHLLVSSRLLLFAAHRNL